MKTGWIVLLALLAACGPSERERPPQVGASIPGATIEGPVRFRFAPPDGTEYVETLFDRTRRDCEALPTNVVELEEKIAVTIRRSDTGYARTAKYLSVRSWHNGDGYNDRYLAHLVGKELVHRLDDGGRVVAVDGLSEVVRLIRTTVPDIPMPWRPVGSDRDALAGLTSQWQRRIGALAASSIAVGGAAETTHRVPLLSGRSLVLPETISIPRLAYCPAGRCVLVWLDSHSNDVALAEDELIRLRKDPAMRRVARRDFPKPVGAEVTWSTSLVIDPDTMLIYKETGSQVTRFTIDVPGYGPASYASKEEWRSTFDYPKAPTPPSPSDQVRDPR